MDSICIIPGKVKISSLGILGVFGMTQRLQRHGDCISFRRQVHFLSEMLSSSAHQTQAKITPYCCFATPQIIHICHIAEMQSQGMLQATFVNSQGFVSGPSIALQLNLTA